MKKILVVIEKGIDGKYSAYTPNTKSTILNGQGNTVEEAITDLKMSMEEIIESYLETDGQVPDELQGAIEFEYKYDVPSLFNFFDEINMTTFSKKIGINASLLRRYKTALPMLQKNRCIKLKMGYTNLGNN